MACHSCKNFTEFSDTIEVDLLTTQHILATATQILHVLDQRSGALVVTEINRLSIQFNVILHCNYFVPADAERL